MYRQGTTLILRLKGSVGHTERAEHMLPQVLRVRLAAQAADQLAEHAERQRAVLAPLARLEMQVAAQRSFHWGKPISSRPPPLLYPVVLVQTTRMSQQVPGSYLLLAVHPKLWYVSHDRHIQQQPSLLHQPHHSGRDYRLRDGRQQKD